MAVQIAGQAFVNMGVASGLLPTKGLTLPFVSSGGSSLIICCALLGLALRVRTELRGPIEGKEETPGLFAQLPIFTRRRVSAGIGGGEVL